MTDRRATTSATMIRSVIVGTALLARTVAAEPTVAQALVTEGVTQLQQRAFEQALANFLEAYGRDPRPETLLIIASALRDMGRAPDAANTYQRYLLDPAAPPGRLAEIADLLATLDTELTRLTVRVSPPGAELSIDGGPFLAVGSSLVTRVRPGLHLVRVRNGEAIDEIMVTGFEAEAKEIAARGSGTAGPEQVWPWLTTGTLYSAADATSNVRKARATFQGDELVAILPDHELTETGEIRTPIAREETSSGVVAVMRIDGEGRGFAGGIGLAISRGHVEVELMMLRSELTGGYLGMRYRLFTGFVRPYLAAGVPGFVYEDMDQSQHVAVGVRAAAGVELGINRHLSVQADLGYEHFFVDAQETRFDANVFVPTLGIVGRL